MVSSEVEYMNWCHECRLTPAAADLMRRALEDMHRTRPDDDEWRPLLCERCGEVSGIVDEREGWVFGDAPVSLQV
jgi:hypothetical protein